MDKYSEANAPPSLHDGVTHIDCLERLISEAKRYDGAPIPIFSQSPTGESRCVFEGPEHPLHLAVRLVESWQDPKKSFGMMRWRCLPQPASEHWGVILRESRTGRVRVRRSTSRYNGFQDFGKANPKAAKAAALELAQWASMEQTNLRLPKRIDFDDEH